MQEELHEVHMDVQRAIVEYVSPGANTVHGTVHAIGGCPYEGKSWVEIKGTENELEIKIEDEGEINIEDGINENFLSVDSADEVSTYIEEEYLHN